MTSLSTVSNADLVDEVKKRGEANITAISTSSDDDSRNKDRSVTVHGDADELIHLGKIINGLIIERATMEGYSEMDVKQRLVE